MNLSYRNRNLLQLYYRLPQFIREIFASLYSLKVRNRRFGKAFFDQIEMLKVNSNLSPDTRAQKQIADLRAMLVYAHENVPYYRDLFDKVGFNPKKVCSLDDLRSIPLLERDILRAQNENLHAKSFEGGKFIHSTSGTTGTALKFTLSEETNQRHYGCVWYHYGWAGVKRGDRIATFGAHPLVHPDRKKPPFWLYDSVENELYFSIQHISPKTASYYAEKLMKFKPVMVRGIPSFLNLIAQYMLEKGISYTPKAVFTYSETLLDRQRKAMEQAFNCPVYNFYSNGERTGHILQCQHGSLHVLSETSVVEVVRPDGSPAAVGEVGELVITNLINKAMPLIRYRIGDTGVVAESGCPCGRQTPILRNLTGRTNDFLVTGDGLRLRPVGVFANTPNVKVAQFIQEEVGSVIVKIVPRDGYGPADEKHIMEELRWELGKMTNIQIQLVDGISFGSNGKFQHIISKVPA